MGKIILTCSKCGNQQEFGMNIPANLTCQSCGGTEVIPLQELLLKCKKCEGKVHVNSNRKFSTIHDACRGSIWEIKGDVEPEVVEEGEGEERRENSKVSVVVVSHNKLEITKECIKRLRKTTVEQIILVDNNSTDDTVSWAMRQKDIELYRNQMNFGCVIARNQGAKYAVGDWIFFIDNDQYVPEDIISKLKSVGEDLNGIEHWSMDKRGDARPKGGAFLINDYIGAGGLLIKRRVFEDLGGFDEQFAPAFYEDPDLSFRARMKGYSFGILKEHGIEHLEHKTISSQKTFDWKKVKERSKGIFLEKWNEFLHSEHFIIPEKKIEERKEIENQKNKKFKERKPKIYIAVDTPGWAWDNKTQQITKYLEDEFDFVIDYGTQEGLNPPLDCDLYFTYELNWLRKLKLPADKIITGVTAHTYTNMKDWKQILEGARAIHANSMLLYEEICELNNNCFYLPNGVDEKLFDFSKRDKRKKFTVGYVGKGTERKGFEKFVKPACKEAGVDLAPLVGGIKEKRVPHKQMSAYYKSLDCVMIASDMDGTPNMLLEAAGVGRTFIANRIGNVPEFHNKENGIIVKKRRIKDYVRAINELQEDRNACDKMGLEARKEVERNWTWKIQSENYRKMFWDMI